MVSLGEALSMIEPAGSSELKNQLEGPQQKAVSKSAKHAHNFAFRVL